MLFLAGLYLYAWLTNPLIELTKGILRMEVPFLLYTYYCLNVLTRESKWRPLLAAIPLATLYWIHDYYFMRFFRIPKLNDLVQIPELVGVIGFAGNLTLVVVLLLVVVLIVFSIRYSIKGLMVALPVMLIVVAPFAYPARYVELYSWLSIEVIHYANVVNVEYNGRFVTALYNEAKRRDTLSHISKYRDIDKLALKLPPSLEVPDKANGKNVHMIILEGFLDPNLLTQLPVSVKPTHPDFTRMIGTKQGFSVSPVFGGYTAQAEFEIFCGVPAFQEFDEIEFNVMSGAPTYCLPGILQQLGYRTTASNGFKPDFFNTMPAYRSLGFGASYFAKEYTPTMETYLSKGPDQDNKYFFDKDLYEQNLAFVKQMIADKKPFFNYLLTVYGHFPFNYDNRMGPPLFKLPEISWDLERIINQHYYRSQALASYLQQLLVLDPNSLIVLVSDHLPPLQEGFGAYESLGYLDQNLPDRFHRNRFFVFREGQAEVHDIFYHFNIYRLILDYVTNNEYCKTMKCNMGYPLDKETLRNDYRIIMGLGSRQQAKNN